MTLRVDWYLYQAFRINIKGARAILVKSLTYQALTRNTTIRLITLWAETVQYDLLRYEHRKVIEHWLLKFWDRFYHNSSFWLWNFHFGIWNLLSIDCWNFEIGFYHNSSFWLWNFHFGIWNLLSIDCWNFEIGFYHNSSFWLWNFHFGILQFNPYVHFDFGILCLTVLMDLEKVVFNLDLHSFLP